MIRASLFITDIEKKYFPPQK